MAGSKRRQKLEQEQRRRKKREARRSQSYPVHDIVEQAAGLVSRRQWQQARELLESCDQDHPGDTEVLELLLDVYQEQRDFAAYCRVCQQIVNKHPDSGAAWLMLAAGCLADARPASAFQAFQRFVERWPDDPLAEGARESLAEIEPVVEELLRDAPFPPDQKIELAALHEEVLASLSEGEYDRVIRLGEKLLARCPDFLPVLNNLSQGYFLSGRIENALAASREVLQREPENFHALANLARHLFLAGRLDEARQTAQRLRCAQSDKLDIWCKKAETFSFLGDDQAVLETFAGAQQAGYTAETTPDVAVLFHLAAVASARQGDHRQARQHWQRALQIQPGFELARENLADAKQPAAERHGPWAYSINYWVPERTIQQLAAAFESPSARRNEQSTQKAALRFDQQHPEVAGLVPHLLERGDRAGREFAWRYALLLDTPAMHEALRVFCLSQRGPDSLRLETANRLSQKGVFPAGRPRLWIDGDWQEIELFGFEITNEPSGPGHLPEVEAWAQAGMQAIRDGQGARAAELFQKCLATEGDRPEFLNNLAAAYDVQGKQDESRRLLYEIHERWPDYFFGRIAMANLASQEGRFDEAEALLAPLRQQRRLHFSEFIALCTSFIQLLLAQRNVAAARSWLKLFQEFAPDHPEVARLERAVAHSGTLGQAFDRLANLFTRPRKSSRRGKTK